MSPALIMEQEKPFKTIEVIDSRTGKQCKIACMSCIRGHRTTSCGIPVCRSKIFWTVKRPGRPSNSCTCRYGPGGRCECVVAKSACPHKPKKGEKRTVDCRCDEQGRYCCLLESEHWDQLVALQKPTVELFSSRDGLESRGKQLSNESLPPTPAYTVGSPQTLGSVPSTPGPTQPALQPISPAPPVTQFQPPPVTPRFGMMGVGTPWSSGGYQSEDVLVWDGQAPPAPREFSQYAAFDSNSTPTPSSTVAPQQAYPASYSYVSSQFPNTDFTPVTQSMQDMTLPPDTGELPSANTFDFEKMMADYFSYQFPSAICQNCGLNGCSCRNCPAVMQNFESGSWAQGCARKHVRLTSTATVQASGGCCSRNVVAVPRHDEMDMQHDTPMNGSIHPLEQDAFGLMEIQTAEVDPTLTQDFSIHDLKMIDPSDPMDLSEFLNTDFNGLEEPEKGCCCGGR